MVSKHELPENIHLHTQGPNCKACIYELEDHVSEEWLNLNESLGLQKKNHFANFPSRLLESV